MTRCLDLPLIILLTTIATTSSATCHAEKDQKTAARQARIDTALAESKIKELRSQQKGARTVQDESSLSIKKRFSEITAQEQHLKNAQQNLEQTKTQKKP